MTDSEIEKKLDEMEELFGILPDPEVFPKSFEFLVRLYNHRMKLREEAAALAWLARPCGSK